MSERRWLRSGSEWANLSIIGIQFPVAIVIGYLWGRGMDRLFGTYPWLTVIFSVFGIAAGFVNLFRIAARAGENEEREAREKKGDGESGDGPPAA